MSRKWLGFAILIAIATLLLNTSSCGFNQHLVGIQIAPSSGTFGAAASGAYFDFSAVGTYIHPPATKSITSLVTWGTDNPQVVTISTAGVASPGPNCGVANITASFYDSPNLVTSNTSTITVDGPTSSGCTPAGPLPILTVNFGGTGMGTVISSPAGIDCSYPSSCNASFETGQTVTLTGTPTGGSTSVTWTGCGIASGETCTVVMEIDMAVTATFQ
jgi:hypothetical protein